MSTWIQSALWLIMVIFSSTACFQYGSSIATQSSTTRCAEQSITASFADANRALDMVESATADSERSAHLANLRVAIFRLAEPADDLPGWQCSAAERQTLDRAKLTLSADPDQPEWMAEKIAPALGICARRG